MKLFAVLDKLLEMLNAWMASREQKKVQEARNEIENSPADWFLYHFDGLSDDSQSEDSKTDKT